MIRVLIVDDHEIVRVGIRRLLADAPDIEVIGEVDSGELAIKFAKEMKPDVILMDIKMPGIGGLGATRKIKRIHSKTRVLILTVCEGDPLPMKFLQAGARGYITKGSCQEEMFLAIRTVFEGKRYVGQDLAQQFTLNSADPKQTPLGNLSDRELQILLMITQGQRVNKIGEILCLSPKTVNTYRYRIFEKLHVKSDVELTHFAIRHKLIESAEE